MTPLATIDARDEFVVAGGVRFHCRVSGDADAATVLLLHGLTGNAWEWDPVAAVLSKRFRVLALDQRGHGASAWASDYAAERMVDDVAEILAAIGLETVAVVGHSMGALNGFLFAARRPELVERLAIVDFGPDSMTPEAVAGWSASLRATAQAAYPGPEAALAEWRSANPRARRCELLHFIRHNLAQDQDGRWMWRFDAAGLESFLHRSPDPAIQWAALRQVTCPTLVIRGEHSYVLSRQTAARMAQELTEVELVEIADGAHDLTVEQPAALTEALQLFLTAG